MFRFFSEAKQELEHVVWPTANETKKYMTYTVGVIIFMSILLQVLGLTLRSGLSIVRDQFPHETITSTVSGEAGTSADLENIINSLSGKLSGTGTIKNSSGTVKSDGVIEVTPAK